MAGTGLKCILCKLGVEGDVRIFDFEFLSGIVFDEDFIVVYIPIYEKFHVKKIQTRVD